MADNGNVEVRLRNVRLSFAHIFTAQQPKPDANGNRGKAKFNCSFLMQKDTAHGKKNIDAMKAAIKEAAKGKWGDNIPKLKAEKFCLRDGDNEDWDGYGGCMYVSASNARRPQVVDRDPNVPLVEADGKPYSGCYVNAVVRVWAQDNEHGKRINASLEAIQFVKDGEAFGPAPIDPNEAFEDLGDDEDGDEGDTRSSKSSRRTTDDDDDGDSLL